MAGPVLWRVEPIAGESLASLVTRTTRRNLLPSAHVLLRQVGVRHANNPTAALHPGVDERRLADILRLPLHEISRRRHKPRAEAGFVDFYGAAVRADEMVFRRRRFAPSAIATSPHSRDLWSFKTVPCCTETWEYLIDACRCGAVQRWQAADRLERCDVCNAPLGDAPADKVEDGLREGLGFLIGLLDPVEERRSTSRTQLPDAFASWDGGLVFEMAMALTSLTAEHPPRKRGREPDASEVRRHAASLAGAADMIREWPGALTDMLTVRVADQAISRRNVRYNGLTYHLKGLSSAVLPTPVRNALKEVLATISSSPGRVPPDQIGMREAALLTGQEERKLAAARRAGQLGTRICLRANRLLPTLDRREIETLNAFLHSRVGPEAASHRLGLPQYALHLIAREGLIRFADHPYVVAHYGPGQMDEAELVRFQDRLRDCATGIDLEDPVPLRKAARAIGGGAKPWGTIVRGLMTGGIPFGMGGDGIDDIVISGLDAARIRTFPTCGEGVMPLRCISQRDAVEILNLPLRHANLLGRSLKTGGSLRLPVADVLELARVRVTLAELCALTGIHGTRLEAMLEKDGCSRRDAMGWSRDVAIKRVARL